MDLPVVQTIPSSNSLILVAPSAKKYVTRLLAAADFSGNSERRDAIRGACALALAYQNGEVEESSLGLERYLIIKVAPFPDIYEGLAEFHRAKGDSQSGLVTCERAAQAHPGWGRAHAFHARYLQEIGREREASDAAKFCLQMPLWTVGNKETIREMGRMAGYVDDASLGKIYRRLYEDPRKEDIQGGKRPEQVALDRAAYLLDVCVSEELGWEDIKEDLAVLYDSAGLQDLATFVRY